MNYGSIAYLNDGKLFIPSYLLRPFNIDNNTSLTILSYTTPKSANESDSLKKLAYENLPQKHDLIITPIPFRLWPFLIRVKILLQERNGAVAALTNYFHSRGLNILTADCHRAGFRYMVYSCFLECSKLRKEYSNIGEIISKESKSNAGKEGIYEPNKKWKELGAKVIKEVEVIREELKELPEEELKKVFKAPYDPNEKISIEVRKFLFTRTGNEDDHGMVSEVEKSATLPYHYLQVMERTSQTQRVEHHAKYKNGSIILPDSLISEFINNHKIDLKSKEVSPTFGFVNVDTKSPRVRVTFTPKNQIWRFRRVIIDYRRDSVVFNSSNASNSSLGLVAIVSKVLTSKFKLTLENVVNRIWLNKKRTELGKVEIIAEQPCNSVINWKKVEKSLKNEITKQAPEINSSQTVVKCTRINPFTFFVSLKTKDEKLVKSTKKLLYKAGKYLGILKEDFKFVWTHNAPVTNSVIRTLKETNALIQIYHTTSLKKNDDFTWLDSEFLAMRALDKPYARICSDNRYFKNEFSKFDKDVMPYVINFSHGDEVIIKKYKEVIRDLINRIDENEPKVLHNFK